MNANQADAKVRAMCRVLQLSPSGYYAWRDRAPSQRAIDNAVLTGCIRDVSRLSVSFHSVTFALSCCHRILKLNTVFSRLAA